MDIYQSVHHTDFIDYNVGGHHVMAPDFLVRHHPRADWERERFASMARYLSPGMVLFDVGAEQGYMSAIYSRFVGGGENMVLFEPVPQVWPNIRHTWLRNSITPPRATYCGLVSDHDHVSEYHDFVTGYRDVWPECAYGDMLLDATKFRYETEHAHCTDTIRLDTFVESTGIKPDAITVDVEGFEPLVMEGAKHVLTRYRPLVWLSLHEANNIMNRSMGGDSMLRAQEFMTSMGYRSEWLATDHEQHWRYWYEL